MNSKIFNYISTISCIIAIILLYSFIAISDSFYINGCTILIFLLMLLNPIANLCRLNKKIITKDSEINITFLGIDITIISI